MSESVLLKYLVRSYYIYRYNGKNYGNVCSEWISFNKLLKETYNENVDELIHAMKWSYHDMMKDHNWDRNHRLVLCEVMNKCSIQLPLSDEYAFIEVIEWS